MYIDLNNIANSVLKEAGDIIPDVAITVSSVKDDAFLVIYVTIKLACIFTQRKLETLIRRILLLGYIQPSRIIFTRNYTA